MPRNALLLATHLHQPEPFALGPQKLAREGRVMFVEAHDDGDGHGCQHLASDRFFDPCGTPADFEPISRPSSPPGRN